MIDKVFVKKAMQVRALDVYDVDHRLMPGECCEIVQSELDQ